MYIIWFNSFMNSIFFYVFKFFSLNKLYNYFNFNEYSLLVDSLKMVYWIGYVFWIG